jgi:hypothetical protein
MGMGYNRAEQEASGNPLVNKNGTDSQASKNHLGGTVMPNVVVIGAGIGAVPMAFEMKGLLRKGEKLTVISNALRQDRF